MKLAAVDGHARLTVRDTGVGIRPEEVPKVFDRFHRARESRGRTHEGTGIGLALVRELVHLHAGTIRLESQFDAGSRFIVSVPLGQAHLDPRRIRALPERASGHLAAQAFVKEAMRWTPGGDPSLDQLWAQASRTALDSAPAAGANTRPATARPKILWADDNADMRDYVKRLLAERFEVTAVGDGEAALTAIRAERPELVLSDVMMPKLDGFSLIRALRTDPALNTIPVILLSARAGEEARVEGVEAGADDYLIKPFSARELLARVESHLKMARFRRESEAALRESEGRFRQANLELAGRLAELQQATAEIRDSRRAAMNLMQDAVLARDQVEKLNRDLRVEIGEREAAHKLLRLAPPRARAPTRAIENGRPPVDLSPGPNQNGRSASEAEDGGAAGTLPSRRCPRALRRGLVGRPKLPEQRTQPRKLRFGFDRGQLRFGQDALGLGEHLVPIDRGRIGIAAALIAAAGVGDDRRQLISLGAGDRRADCHARGITDQALQRLHSFVVLILLKALIAQDLL